MWFLLRWPARSASRTDAFAVVGHEFVSWATVLTEPGCGNAPKSARIAPCRKREQKTDRAEDAQIAYASRPRSVQLEVLATDQRAAFARSLLAPWLKKAGE
jgi:hypothetical protein